MKTEDRLLNAAKSPIRVITGEYNFKRGINNDLARERYENACKNCIFFADEPNELLKEEDRFIPELSSKYCDHPECGCISRLKLRVKKENCPLGKW